MGSITNHHSATTFSKVRETSRILGSLDKNPTQINIRMDGSQILQLTKIDPRQS